VDLENERGRAVDTRVCVDPVGSCAARVRPRGALWFAARQIKPVTFSSLNGVRGDPRKLRENREAEPEWSPDAASLLEVARRPAA
jgi:hypothetical protein